MPKPSARTYLARDAVVFRKTTEEFGGLSNMAPGFPIEILGVRIRTSEALYQACRFPDRPDVQELILSETSPMTAKMKSKPFRECTRSDWDHVRVPVMKWCLRVKLSQNWRRFSTLLRKTSTKPIVEESRKDDFWGAKPTEDGRLEGSNVLGRLLMELREKLDTNPASLALVRPVPIPQFSLLGHPIPPIASTEAASSIVTLGAHMCKWPIGDPALDNFTFCGRKIVQGGYCLEHAQIAYAPSGSPTPEATRLRALPSLRRLI